MFEVTSRARGKRTCAVGSTGTMRTRWFFILRTNGPRPWRKRRTCAGRFVSITVTLVRIGSNGLLLWGKSVSDSNGFPSTTGNCGRLAGESLKRPKPRKRDGQGSCGEL